MNRHLSRIILLIAILFLVGCENEKDQNKKVSIGIVNLTPTVADTIRGFKDGMSEHGYIEGKNVTYLYEGPVKRIDALDDAIQKVLSQNPDLILSLLTPVTSKLKQATAATKTPIIFGPVGDPVAAKIVGTLKEPGGNLTGVRVFGWEPKALEWFTRLVPGLDTLWVPYKPDERAMTIGLNNLKKAIEGTGISLSIQEIQNKDDLLAKFANIPPEVDGVWALGSGFWGPFVDDYIQAAISNNLPLKGTTADWTERGALFSFSEDPYRLGLQQARMAVAVLAGATTSSIPVEQADFYLSINPDTAESIHLNLSDALLKQADFIIRKNEKPNQQTSGEQH